MRGVHHREYSGWGRLALWMIVLAMILRAAVPAGWMPDSNRQGFRIILCSGSGPMTMPMMATDHGIADHGKAPQPANSIDHPCTFAGLSAALIGPADLPVLLPLAMAAASTFFATQEISIGHGLAAPPPPPTGPPANL